MDIIKYLLPSLLILTVSGSTWAAEEALVTNSNVAPLTRFLEEQPLHKDAPVIRAALLQWEEPSKDVVDVVCPGIFKPIPDKSIKYSGELLAQFIFGSAAYQLENPSEKGKLMPSQLAGMQSMLKAYRSFLAQDPEARIPRLDQLSQDEASGKLLEVLGPLVSANCKSPASEP